MEELNEAIADLLERLNDRKLKRVSTTRRKLLEKPDAPAPRPLPPRRYEFLEWRTAEVGIDYHVWSYCKKHDDLAGVIVHLALGRRNPMGSA